MKFTYNWIKEFIPRLRLPAEALAERLTMAGLEIKSAEKRGPDVVFEAEITSNRPDWLSVIGIAREVAALTGISVAPLKKAAVKKKEDPAFKGFSVPIENSAECPLYNASIVTGVTIGPSPAWLKERLEAIGCRSINNVVDITNYCMFTWGQPLHAFDLDKLAPGSIGVRRARSGEKLVTIDGQEHSLSSQALVICDRTRPVALAGVMGGKDTEVSGQTTRILLEAAIFDPLVVRQSRRGLGLSSDASYRFERTVDIGSTEEIAQAALSLIQKIAGGTCVHRQSSRRIRPHKKSIIFDIESAHRVLGIKTISLAQAKRYLHSLGFASAQKNKKTLAVEIPSFRPDVSSPIDLIEEIARVHGYDTVPAALPAVIPQCAEADSRSMAMAIKQTLTGLGLQEAITYSFLSAEMLKGFEEFGRGVEVANPLSKEQELLRPTLLPGLLKCIAANLNQKQEHVAFFEVADVFVQPAEKGVPVEETRLSAVLCGQVPLWLADRPVKDTPGFLHLKGILEAVCRALRIDACAFRASTDAGHFDFYIEDKKAGVLLMLPRRLLEEREIKNKDVYALEVSLGAFASAKKAAQKYRPLPRFPYIQRDISIALKDETRAEEVMALIAQGSKGFLQEAPRVIDYYKGEHIEKGYKGLTVSCRYACPDRTLTEAEINPIHEATVQSLIHTLGARVR